MDRLGGRTEPASLLKSLALERWPRDSRPSQRFLSQIEIHWGPPMVLSREKIIQIHGLTI